MKGNGYGSFFAVTFSFLKFIQIFGLSFFLGIITMGDNHVASSTNCINPVAYNLSIFYLTIVA